MNIEKDDRKIGQEHLTVGNCESIFEAIMVIGKRTRQINEKNKKDFEDVRRRIVEGKRDKEKKKDMFVSDSEELPKFEKSERIALHEFFDGKLEHDYHDLTKIVE